MQKEEFQEKLASIEQEFTDVATQLADLGYEKEQLRMDLSETKASVDTDVRINPAKYHVQRITEAAVHNAVVLNQQYKQVLQQLLEVNRDMDVLEATRESLKVRLEVLKMTSLLFNQQ